MEQERLFRLAVEAVNVHARFEPGVGWLCTVGYRRQDERWDSAYRASYAALATPELLEVICAEMEKALGLA